MHFGPIRLPWKHGTVSGYTVYGCRQGCCREPYNAYIREWRKRDTPAAQRHRKRLALRKGIRRQRIYDRDGGICYLCDTPVDPKNWHVEHKIPRSRGGSNEPDNLGVSCPPCNMRKRNKLLEELSAQSALDESCFIGNGISTIVRGDI